MDFPLVVKSKLDWNLYKQFAWLRLLKNRLFCWFVLAAGVVGFSGVLIGLYEADWRWQTGGVLMMLYPLLIVALHCLQIRKFYRKNPSMQLEELDIFFEEEGFTAKTPQAQSYHAYTELVAIHENKVLYALMLGKNIGQVIRKEDCSLEVLAWIEELKATYPKK